MQENINQQDNVSDVNITHKQSLPSPDAMRREIAMNPNHREFVSSARHQIHDVLFGDDKRLLFIVGPCSIHDVEAGREFAERLKTLSNRVNDRLLLVMRAYFEKPRTSVGWKGLIMDPHLDGSYNISEGLSQARRFLRDIIELELPTATELLDPITPQYIADSICWSCIGARTTESQTHRQMASGLSMPLGFKNGTDGRITAAVNAIKAASNSQTFLGIEQTGTASAITTKGNPNCHIVLRGGNNGPNFTEKYVRQAQEELKANDQAQAVMIDCSHGNSNKDYTKQPEVLKVIAQQAATSDSPIIGGMLESNLNEGKQSFPQPLDQLAYGVSITDGCIDMETTEQAILDVYDIIGKRFS